ncbi:MAG TPA: M20/M25/M40 family metallo-hydrolase [bacterium]|nr:M20/M25/M40 family metallo-hydrolase [bacterium]
MKSDRRQNDEGAAKMLTDSDVKRMSEEVQRHLINLIRIDTTNPPGNETAACEYMKAELAKDGLESEILESAPGRGNFVCRLKGDGSKRPLALASHLDVVPCERESWSVDPYAAVVKDGFIWGRGSLDTKSLTAIQMVTVAELKRKNIPLKRDVILLAVADEEQSGSFGMGWMTANHFDKIDCEYQINEGAGIGIPMGNKNVYQVQTAEKGANWFKLTTRGEPGHGSIPRKDNCVVRMAKAIEKVSHPLPMRKTKVVEGFINGMASKALGFPKGLLFKQLLNPALCGPVLKAIRSAEPDTGDMLSSMLRDSISPTMFHAGNKENVIPPKCEAVIDCRILPGQTSAGFKKMLSEMIDVDSIELLVEQVPDPTESPADTELYRCIERAIMKNDPKGVLVPYISTGATDSRFLRKKGVIAYGFSPFLSKVDFREFLYTIHGHDERIPIDGVDFSVRVTYDLVADFCG